MPLDFLAVGHLTVDRLESGCRLGGAAAYSAITAHRLGLRAGIVTSVGAEFPFFAELEGIEIHNATGEATTVFENTYRENVRSQRLLGRAASLDQSHLARVRVTEEAAVLYCPVVDEVRMPLDRLAPRGLSGVAAQGFFRQWDEKGRVTVRDWPDAADALSRADFVCLSEDDAEPQDELAARFPGIAWVVTRGAGGCRVHARGAFLDFPAFPANVVDPTGAGDVFAAAFLIALKENMPLPLAARFASGAAAIVVEGMGTSSIPCRAEVEARIGR
ncbi:MAG TPA: PfkB family carbohydrate kinase [Vicinamibacteria bacterium]|nr:PfkB family carbohydrate kinase [Vicinamibacteria bacterium]